MPPSQRLQPVHVDLPAHGVFVLESVHGSGFRMEASAHEFWELFFVMAGEGVIELDGNRIPCAGDDVIIVPPGTVHRIEDQPGRPLALYALCLSPAWMALDPDTRCFKAGRMDLPGELLPRLRSDLRRLLFVQSIAQPGAAHLLAGRALTLLGLMTRGVLLEERRASADGGKVAVMAAYVKDLEQRFFESMNLDEEAARLRMSRRRFTQLFRAHTGESWLAHLNRLRVEHARHLLRQTQRSVTAIAFECGFEELSSFYRAFKKHTGLTPLGWRQSAASE